MACHTNKCCCGCIDQKNGIVIAGFVDVISVFIYGIVRVASRNLCGIWDWYLTIWCLGHFIGGMLLITSVGTNSSGLLMIWMVTGLVNIVFGVIAWIRLPLNCSDAFGYEYITQMQYAEECIFYALVVWTLIYPIYYVYLWIVVRNYQRNLTGKCHQRNTDTTSGKMTAAFRDQVPQQHSVYEA